MQSAANKSITKGYRSEVSPRRVLVGKRVTMQGRVRVTMQGRARTTMQARAR